MPMFPDLRRGPLPAIWRVAALAAIATTALIGCDRAETPVERWQPDDYRRAEGALQQLPLEARPASILVDDVDGNGLQDLIWLSSVPHRMQVYYQGVARAFGAGPSTDEVGFHARSVMRLAATPKGRRLYLVSSEGTERLSIFEPGADGSLTLRSSIPARSPRYTVELDWPGWGLGLAVAPFQPGSLVLMKSVDPLAGKAGSVYGLKMAETMSRSPSILATDLDGDGIDEVLYLDDVHNALFQVHAPTADRDPRIEQIWNPESTHEFPPVVATMTIADLDANGKPDVLVAMLGVGDVLLPGGAAKPRTAAATIRVLMNDGTGRLLESGVIDYPKALARRDRVDVIDAIDHTLDAEGRSLIMVASPQSVALIRLDPATPGRVRESRVLPTGKHTPWLITLVDIDGDGHDDAVMGGATGSEASALILYGPLWEAFGERQRTLGHL